MPPRASGERARPGTAQGAALVQVSAGLAASGSSCAFLCHTPRCARRGARGGQGRVPRGRAADRTRSGKGRALAGRGAREGCGSPFGFTRTTLHPAPPCTSPPRHHTPGRGSSFEKLFSPERRGTWVRRKRTGASSGPIFLLVPGRMSVCVTSVAPRRKGARRGGRQHRDARRAQGGTGGASVAPKERISNVGDIAACNTPPWIRP